MSTRFKIKKTFSEDIKLLNQGVRKQTLSYIILAGIMLMVVAGIGIFSVPSFVSAYSISSTNVNGFNTNRANTLLLDYANNSTALFSKEDFDLSQFDIEPVKPVYHSDVNYYMYSGYYGYGTIAANKAWSHGLDLFSRGLIYGSDPYQCTFFAQMWFYDIYGFNSTGYGPSGNGDTFARRVYDINVYYDEDGNLQHYFKIDDHPETMGLVSISGRTPHVLCVDEVDYENGTITISDGNVNGGADVRIRKTYTLQEFYAVNPGYYTFVNPTKEMIDIVKNR